MLVWIKKLRFLLLLLVILIYCLTAAVNAEIGVSRIPDVIFGFIFIIILLSIAEQEKKLYIYILLFGIIKFLMSILNPHLSESYFHATQSFIAMIFFCLMTAAT